MNNFIFFQVVFFVFDYDYFAGIVIESQFVFDFNMKSL